MRVTIGDKTYSVDDVGLFGLLGMMVDGDSVDQVVLPKVVLPLLEEVYEYTFNTFVSKMSSEWETKINLIPTPLVGGDDSVSDYFRYFQLDTFGDKMLVQLVSYSQYLLCEPLRKLVSAAIALRLRQRTHNEIVEFFSVN